MSLFYCSSFCVQLYWTNYSTGAYVTALQHLHALQCPPNNLITTLGIVNFDSVCMDEICTALGPAVIVSNQIQVISSLQLPPAEMLTILLDAQFSLIDTQPLYGMSDICMKHNVRHIYLFIRTGA